MTRMLRQAATMLLLFTLLTGVAYPLVVTGIAQLIFAHTANGSLIQIGDKAVGSRLIGQPFADPKYFWSRPSATSPSANNATASSGSNLSATNSALADAIKQRVDTLQAADPDNHAQIPADLVTASASGLDPQISPAAAQYQVARVARVRGIAPEFVARLLEAATEGRQFGFLGEPRVNVLQLNLSLDAKQ